MNKLKLLPFCGQCKTAMIALSDVTACCDRKTVVEKDRSHSVGLQGNWHRFHQETFQWYLSHLLAAVLKHHDKETYRKKSLSLWFQRARVHDGGMRGMGARAGC